MSNDKDAFFYEVLVMIVSMMVCLPLAMGICTWKLLSWLGADPASGAVGAMIGIFTLVIVGCCFREQT